MRLFTAIELPEAVRAHVSAVATKVRQALESRDTRPPVSWTKESNLHVTLKFLGDVPEERVPGLLAALRTIGLPPPPLRLRAESLEAFPSRGSARVLVVRVGGDVERLAALHAAIEDRCSALGFERENRRYRPHVTIGRPRVPLRGRWEAMAGATSGSWPGPEFSPAAFSLVQSQLDPAGAIYTTIEAFRAFD